ncbi:MAG TPA: enoyl-CoA hydratase/isomerase family protein [Burkholderiales bacterium]|nr:enoyl-CoA hydratase/isomerase family protein [Burkholderiales bacterium]
MTEHVLLAIDDAVATVTLNRPEKLNALTMDMIDALSAVAMQLDADRAVRCVILTGAGERAFCVGADINAWSALEALDMWRMWTKRGHQVFDQWAQLRQPVIAAVNGHALGGGLELAAAADLRVASAAAQFGLPEASIATVPGWSGTQRLTGIVGPSRVKYLALTGRRLSADEAWRAGLVHEVAGDEGLMPAALRLARDICSMAPVSVQLVKQLINASSGAGMASALEGMAGALAGSTQDAREGLASFRERRPPRYQGS